jgi:hypothetical protein
VLRDQPPRLDGYRRPRPTIFDPHDERSVARFMRSFTRDEATGCWLWTRAKTRGGYGQMRAVGPAGLVVIRAHRFALAMKLGRWPSGLACHTCDNPPCVNPDHLFEGSASDNALDAFKKGRRRPGSGRLRPYKEPA